MKCFKVPKYTWSLDKQKREQLKLIKFKIKNCQLIAIANTSMYSNASFDPSSGIASINILLNGI